MTLNQIPKLTLEAENAERMHLKLMKAAGWTPEQLFEITCYRILDNSQ